MGNKRSIAVSRMRGAKLRSLLPHSLRAKFALALSMLVLLILASGGTAIYALHTATTATQQLAGERLVHLQEAQDLMQNVLLIARDGNQLLTSDSLDTVRRIHADALTHLEALDRLVAKLAAASDDVAVLDLHQSSQLFRNTANIATQLKLIDDREAVKRSHDELQRQAIPMIAAARVLSANFTRDYQDAVHQLAHTSARNQRWALVLLAGSLLCAWLVIHVLLGRHVLERLRQVSHYLRLGEEDNAQPVMPVGGEDEIGDMARAVQSFLQDRRQLAHTRASLEQERKHLAAIFHHTADGIVVLQNDAIQQLNPAAELLFGWRGDEVVGRGITTLISNLNRPDDNAFSTSQDALAHTREGWDFPIEVSVSHVAKSADEKQDGSLAILVVRDVTVRKEIEKELTSARDSAIAAQQAQSAFLANMSHELRTPLNAILGYAQLLKRDKHLTSKQAIGVDTIHQSGDHLLMLINDLLDLSKIHAGRIALFADTLSLRDFLDAIAHTIQAKAEEKDIQFHFEASPDLPAAVEGDEKRLRQALLNLLGNAVKFTDQGRVTLRVSVLARDTGKACLRFEVEDTGIGLTDEQLEPIFLAFEQVGNVNRLYGGTGLGLAISRQLIRLMGSDIHVESQINKGSRFWFDLNLPVVGTEVESASEERIATGYQGARKKVLVVDDVVGNRALAIDLLESLGFEVIEAENGETGLAQAQACLPDLILMDIVMPVMNGLEAIRRLRQLPLVKDIPVIVLSASASQNDQHESLAVGANAFHLKPIEANKVLNEIGTLLHLSWIYSDAPIAPSIEKHPEATIVPPPPDEMNVLHKLAMIGNMREIRQRAAHVASLGERYRPFAEKLRTLAEAYHSEAIMELIEEHSQISKPPAG
jgi:PAS domain S-box-containing protein